MPDILAPGALASGSQFVVLDGQLRHNLCGPNSLRWAQQWGTQRRVSLADLYHRMRAAGRCDPQGTSTLSSLLQQAKADGFRVEVLPYQEPMSESTWRGFFTAHLGKAAILYETANGQALKDLLTGQGEDADPAHPLRYHFLPLVGRRADGAWWAADGCNNVYNPVVNGVRTRIYETSKLVLYSDAVVKASRPVGALAIYPKVQFGGPPLWTKVNPGLARDSQGHTCGGAMFRFMDAHQLLAYDGLDKEVYETLPSVPCDAYLPLSNGTILTARKVATGWEVRNDRAAQVLQAKRAQKPAAAAVPDSKAAAAIAALADALGVPHA